MANDVLVDTVDGIQIITINRPQARNAVNLQVALGIAAALDELDQRDDLRVAIITGAGGTFCSGMDLKAFVKGESPMISGRGFAGFVETPPRKPLIAAVEGYALAGGFEIALACDLIVAADNASFGIPEVKRGLVAAAGGLLRLPRQCPPRIAMELALTGDMLTAQRADHYGLINRLVPAGAALAEAMTLARRIIENAPLATVASKGVIQQSQDWCTDDMFTEQQRIVGQVMVSADAREGASAFAEKRAPVWRGV
jgi:enoyl-CoA hydratase